MQQTTLQHDGAASAQTPQTGMTTPAITPALVRAVADKVYNLMLRDLRVAQERQRATTKLGLNKRGI